MAEALLDNFFNTYESRHLAYDVEALSYAKRFPINTTGTTVFWKENHVKIVGLSENVRSVAAAISQAVLIDRQKRCVVFKEAKAVNRNCCLTW